MPPTIDEQIRLLSRRAERILTEQDLRKKLQHSVATGKPLRIKFGMDPTAPDITLGHAVPLRVIRQFQEWGHKAVLIIGDYTARVGDPTGRNKTRPQLSGEEIDSNARTYVDQLGKILLSDPEKLEVRSNGEWLAKMGLVDIIRLASRKTVAQVLTREDFAKRYAEGVDIRLHEILYPLLQGWDSVMIDADVEMGGSDQLFNNLVGREFQQEDGKEGQVVLVTPLLVGTDGKDKMSKSKGNYIAVTDPPGGQSGMFGKVMRLPDELMESYYALLTDLPDDEFLPLIRSKPRDAKVNLARLIISWLHSPQAAHAAEEEWNRIQKGQGIPQDTPEISVGTAPIKPAALLVKAGLASSNSEAIRKIKEGAVEIDGQKLTDPQKEITISSPVVARLGRRYAKLRP
ncbi:MAG TPA: tyrosine--tRNA ligase [Tepidisphaeraceae bacterium]|jgi:tyrosyl-tRNA synthetase|nr:tyrosine--tRNA ligase [Tepidisphaeraceae bacterium]